MTRADRPMSTPPLRQQLRHRQDVPDQDIDDIVELAQRRQDAEQATLDHSATVAQVKAVAAELDIAPEHVEAAIDDLRRQRAQAAEAAAQAQRGAEHQRTRRTLLLGRIARWAGALFLSLTVLTGGLAVSGRSTLLHAEREVAAAEASVNAAVSRQASLAPQLVALSGAQGHDLAVLQAAVRDASDLGAQRAAADALTAAIATALGELPPPVNDAEATMRLNLQDELTGTQNRVAVEVRRYNAAQASWQAASDSLGSGLAIGLGLARRP